VRPYECGQALRELAQRLIHVRTILGATELAKPIELEREDTDGPFVALRQSDRVVEVHHRQLATREAGDLVDQPQSPQLLLRVKQTELVGAVREDHEREHGTAGVEGRLSDLDPHALADLGQRPSGPDELRQVVRRRVGHGPSGDRDRRGVPEQQLAARPEDRDAVTCGGGDRVEERRCLAGERVRERRGLGQETPPAPGRAGPVPSFCASRLACPLS